ncbi:MAG: hypothetical protein RL199_1757 [Pseudomonadota bacterium]|jgi:biopolymer transport protein ExbD
MKRRAHPHEHTGELNIVPYLDIMVNLVMFMLMSMTGFVSFQVVNVNFPDASSGAAATQDTPQAEKLALTVAVSPRGFYIAAKGGVLPAEAGSVGETVDSAAPPSIPCKVASTKERPCGVEDYDYDALTRKLAAVKKRYPKTTNLFLVSDPTTRYETIIHVMDASRGDAQNPLFPDVAFAAFL